MRIEKPPKPATWRASKAWNKDKREGEDKVLADWTFLTLAEEEYGVDAYEDSFGLLAKHFEFERKRAIEQAVRGGSVEGLRRVVNEAVRKMCGDWVPDLGPNICQRKMTHGVQRPDEKTLARMCAEVEPIVALWQRTWPGIPSSAASGIRKRAVAIAAVEFDADEATAEAFWDKWKRRREAE
ncbi:MAG TPA: hypothetical protein VIF88_12025 [Methylocystis sp.]|jgi:hypothetical protein